MTIYRVVARRSDNIVVLVHPQYGQAMWTTVVTRKNTKCETCGVDIPKRSTAWSPLTNGYNRTHRLCVECVKNAQ